MKKAFLLMEVLISILLIFGVVFSMFQIKENNFSLFERVSKNEKNSSAIVMVALNESETNNQNNFVYLKDVINTNNETLRTQYGDVRVKINDEITDETTLLLQNQSIQVKVVQRELSLDEKFNKKLYTVRFE